MPCIYVIATPIGNLEDISPRALRILREVPLIAAEDTRNTRKLLHLFAIKPKELLSYHDHIEEAAAQKILTKITSHGLDLALVTDAGTPCISDPGYRLISLAHAQGIKVIPIPGPSALTSLVSASGLPSNKFYFVSFLPTKTSARAGEIASWGKLSSTSIVFFETLRRLRSTLSEIQETYPNFRVCIGRELTKLHEEIVNLSGPEALSWLQMHKVLKGEVCVMLKIEDDPEALSADKDSIRRSVTADAKRAFREGASLKSLLVAHKNCGLPRSELYDLLLSVK